MINPNPVHSKNSPYSNQSTPYRASSLPRTLTGSKPPHRAWKKVVLLGFLSLIVAAGTYAFAQYRSLRDNVIIANEGQSAAILSYNPQDIGSKLNNDLFQHIGDGRFNILMVGIGGDNHPGALLTDSIQVMSIDTINKKVALTSIPRDLYVNIPGYGRSKINATYEVGEQQKVGSGSALVKQVVSTVIGAPIQRFALLDFSGAEEAVDALGGIDVEVPKTINDPFFPDDATVGYSPFYIQAGLQHMNGHVALRYARSRETTSDFDRSARQQLIISAMKKKALSVGFAANPLKVTNLLNTLGRHVKTDMPVDELKSVMGIYKDSTQSGSSVLDTSDSLGLLTSTTDPVAGYIAYPIRGLSDFSEIHTWFQKNNPDPLVAKESPSITVVNGGSASKSQLQELVTTLQDYGYTATLSTVPLKKTVTKTQVFDASGGKKPITHNYLASQFSTQVQDGNSVNSGSDFEILYVPSTKK
jgi:LCP family protein required for cell wall assembly